MKILYLTPEDDLQKAFSGLKGPAEIRLAKGVYRQKTEICADNVTVYGEDRETTVLSYGDYAKKIHADGKEYNTFRTYTLCVTGNNVRLYNLTVENTNTQPEKVGQCVALSVHGDNFYAENINLKSTQDTLFLSPFPDDLVVRYRGFIPRRQLYREGANVHFFNRCNIYGTVDYVFGCSEAYFKSCRFVSVHDERGVGYVAAPAHSLGEKRAFSFIDCDFTDGGAGNENVYLARPWRDFGKCSFINCRLDGHIAPALFDKWNDTERDKTARFAYYNLKCNFKASPVGWSAELTAEQVNDIINACECKFNDIKGNF